MLKELMLRLEIAAYSYIGRSLYIKAADAADAAERLRRAGAARTDSETYHHLRGKLRGLNLASRIIEEAIQVRRQDYIESFNRRGV